MYDHFFLPTSTLCCSSGTFRLDVRLPNNVRYVQYSNQQSTLIYARRHVVKRGKTCAVKGSTLKPTSSGGLVSVEACRGKVSCLSRGENAVSCHIWQCDFDLPGGEKGKDTYTWYVYFTWFLDLAPKLGGLGVGYLSAADCGRTGLEEPISRKKPAKGRRDTRSADAPSETHDRRRPATHKKRALQDASVYGPNIIHTPVYPHRLLYFYLWYLKYPVKFYSTLPAHYK